MTLVKRRCSGHIRGRGFDSRHLHLSIEAFLQFSGGGVKVSTGMELGAMTSRVVWRTLRDTQTITANTVIAGNTAKVQAKPFVMAKAAPKRASAVGSPMKMHGSVIDQFMNSQGSSRMAA